MDRQDIVRTDFPEARKGYDRAAVDRRLAAIADAFEELERKVGSGSVAEATGEKVASILEVAERKAAEIEADARRRADEILSEAKVQASNQVERARDAVSRLASELGVGISGEISPGPAEVPEPTVPGPEVDPSPAIVPEPTPPREPEPMPEPVPEPTPDPVPLPTPDPGEPEPPPPAAGNGDDAAARLVAMKMALDGASREEVAERLRSEYSLSEPATLVDDVFARAERQPTER